MRALLLMRGSAGCGKSTFIEKHGLKLMLYQQMIFVCFVRVQY